VGQGALGRYDVYPAVVGGNTRPWLEVCTPEPHYGP
jgi:hypothetical protein